MTGFEPAIFWSQTKRDTKLRYIHSIGGGRIELHPEPSKDPVQTIIRHPRTYNLSTTDCRSDFDAIPVTVSTRLPPFEKNLIEGIEETL